jgi:rhodanese-related sulfurtransferase
LKNSFKIEKKENNMIDVFKALELVKEKKALILDIRSNEERVFTGYIPDSIHVSWANGTSLNKNPRFVREVEALWKKNDSKELLILCRSAQRSVLAQNALNQHGITNTQVIKHGFEGDLNELGQRNKINGWKFSNLPWTQT